MLYGPVLFTGLAALWIILSPPGNMREPIALATVVGLIASLWTARLGGLDGASAPAFRVARLLPLLAMRLPATLRGAGAVMRRALAADVTLKPQLVRIRLRAESDAARGAFAHIVSAAPGAVVVDLDQDDSVLAHVLDEDSVDGRDLAALEGAIRQALDGDAA